MSDARQNRENTPTVTSGLECLVGPYTGVIGEAAQERPRCRVLPCSAPAEWEVTDGAHPPMHACVAHLEKAAPYGSTVRRLPRAFPRERTLAEELCAMLSRYAGEGGRDERAVDTLRRVLEELNRYRHHLGRDLRQWVNDGREPSDAFNWTPREVKRLLEEVEGLRGEVERLRLTAKLATEGR